MLIALYYSKSIIFPDFRGTFSQMALSRTPHGSSKEDTVYSEISDLIADGAKDIRKYGSLVDVD